MIINNIIKWVKLKINKENKVKIHNKIILFIRIIPFLLRLIVNLIVDRLIT